MAGARPKTGHVCAPNALQIGDYTISELNLRKSIGHGCLSTVYKASDRGGTIYAAKHLECETLDEDRRNQLKAFLQMESCAHDNIMKIHERIYDEHGDPWLIMDFCDYGNLDNYFKDFPYQFELFDIKLGFMCQIASGLDYLHSEKIVHRNLKPNNILVAENPDSAGSPLVKIADFTLAKFLDPLDQSSTMGTDICADIMYKGPEFYFPRQPDGRVKYKKSVDVYAEGLMFLAMLQPMQDGCLVPQIEGEQPDDSEVNMSIGQIMYNRHCQDRPPVRLVEERPANGNAANMVRRVIKWATFAEPTYRITAAEMHGYLRQIQANPQINLQRGAATGLQASS